VSGRRAVAHASLLPPDLNVVVETRPPPVAAHLCVVGVHPAPSTSSSDSIVGFANGGDLVRVGPPAHRRECSLLPRRVPPAERQIATALV